jgi:hypothetical protein
MHQLIEPELSCRGVSCEESIVVHKSNEIRANRPKMRIDVNQGGFGQNPAGVVSYRESVGVSTCPVKKQLIEARDNLRIGHPRSDNAGIPLI